MSDTTSNTSRREFIVKSTQTAAGLIAAGGLASCATSGGSGAPVAAAATTRRVIGANDRINVAAIGIRSRGHGLAQGFAREDNVYVKTICDPDSNLFAERAKRLEEIQGVMPGTEQDLRRVLDDPEIDAVVIATPDHWHALAAIWACQAGKDVYVEKPCSYAIWEGRKMVEAARRYNRLMQVGFQNRSLRNVRAAMNFLADGGLGDVYLARGLCFKPRESIGHTPNEPVPAGVDYDLWLGPAPMRPFNKNHFHYEWHWNWTYGCGDIGNQGPHQFDIARWGLGETGHPARISSMGGYYKWDSDQETPNTQSATFEYASGKVLSFEVRGLYTNDEDGIRIGNLFYGTEGWMHLNGTTWKTYLGRKNEPGPSSATAEEFADPMNLSGGGGGNHIFNFIRAMRESDRSYLTSDIESGHVSTCLPHLANISYRVGHDLAFDGANERFTGHGAADANRLLRREVYRKPFVIPEKV
jgi:predicted dehydrogenase